MTKEKLKYFKSIELHNIIIKAKEEKLDIERVVLDDACKSNYKD